MRSSLMRFLDQHLLFCHLHKSSLIYQTKTATTDAGSCLTRTSFTTSTATNDESIAIGSCSVDDYLDKCHHDFDRYSAKQDRSN